MADLLVWAAMSPAPVIVGQIRVDKRWNRQLASLRQDLSTNLRKNVFKSTDDQHTSKLGYLVSDGKSSLDFLNRLHMRTPRFQHRFQDFFVRTP